MTHAAMAYRQPCQPGVVMLGKLMAAYQIRSIQDLAEISGIDNRVLVHLQDGKREMDASTAEKLKPIFGRAAETMLKTQYERNFFDENGRRPTKQELKAIMAQPQHR